MTAGSSGVKIWRANDLSLVMLLGVNGVAADFSPDGQMVAYPSGSQLALWDLYSGNPARYFIGHTGSVTSACFSADSRRLITGSIDHTAKIWDLDPSPLRSDISDSLWAIVGSASASHDVDLGRVLVGSFRDSNVVAFIRNTGLTTQQVKEIRIAGGDVKDFAVVSGKPPFTVEPIGEHAVEFRFTPTAVGARAIEVEIITQDTVLRPVIHGEGVEPSLKVETDLVDFGNVIVGDKKDTTLAVAIKNISTRTLNITGVVQLGPDTSQFIIVDGGGAFSLAPDSGRVVQLRFAPKSLGRSSGRIGFDYGDVGSPAVVGLFGEGIIIGSQPILEAARVLAFPSVDCASGSEERTLEIHNRGTATLDILAAEITGANSADFLLSTPFTSMSIAPGSQDLIGVRFIPQGNGLRTASLLLHCNAAGDTMFAVALSGRSDSFAITASLREIDFGMICPGESIDTTLTLVNLGTTRISVRGAITSDFSLPVTAWALDSSGSRSITLSFPGRINEGSYTGSLTFVDTICGSTVILELKAKVVQSRIEARPLALRALVGSYADTTLTITNPTGRDITITDAQPDDPRFVVIGNPFPLSIPAGISRQIPLRYTPSNTMPVATTLDISGEPCTLSTSIMLEGDASQEQANAVLALPFLEAAPGDTIEIPVVLRSQRNLSGSKVTGFATTLRFNATLLMPVASTPTGTIDAGNDRVIPLLLPSSPVKDSTLATLRFVALLGDDTTTALLLEGSSAIGGEVMMEEVPGRFMIDGICARGRTRLITAAGATVLKQNAPNPVNSSTAIEFEVPEEEQVRLFVTDMYGRQVADLVDTKLSSGRYSITLNAGDLSSGVYYYTLETSWRRISRVLIIRK